ncbi:MAG: hypothetical protein ACYSTY_13280 [Planctomycetota bacterium]
MREALHGPWRYFAIFVGIVLAAIICALAIGFVTSPRGTVGPTVLQAASVAKASIAVLLTFTVATAIACVLGRLTNAAVGLFALGCGLAVLAMRSATVQEIAFSGGSLGLIALETGIWAALVLAAAVVVFLVAGPLLEPAPVHERLRPRDWLTGRAMLSLLCGFVVLPVVWFGAQSQMKGQALAAVFLGAVVVGLAGRLVAPRAQPVLVFAAPCLFGVVGHLIGMAVRGGGLDEAIVKGSMFPLSLPMPIDYAAGSLLGVSVGVGWAKSFLHEEEPDPSRPPTTATR